MNGLPVKNTQLFALHVSLLTGTGPEREAFEIRFWAKVKKGTVDECWEWQGDRNSHGYGRCTIYKGKERITPMAHRISYILCKGPIPAGMQLDHLCRNHGCVNPNHLEAVTPHTNIMRGTNQVVANAQKTTCPRGHPYDLLNTRYRTHGWRGCRTCQRIYNKRRRD